MANKRKILSIFANRFVPDWIEDDAPGFKKFVEYYLKFLEEHYYIEYQNFLSSIDVDIITDINESTKHVSLREELNTLPSVGDIFKGYTTGTESEIYKVLDKANFYIRMNSISDKYDVFPIFDDNEYGFIKGVDPYEISSANLANNTDWTITNMIHNGSVWIAGTENGKLYSSPDGITWTIRYNGSSEPIVPRINDLSIGSGLTIAVCNGGKILTSSDGITWIERSGGFLTDNITGIAHGDIGFTAIGGTVGDIKIATSSDGVTWTQQTVDFSGVTTLTDIEFGYGQFMIGGDNNFIATSLDGVIWEEYDPGFASTDPIISISYQNQKFIVGSINNKISISETGETWERKDGVFFDDFQLRKVIFRGSTYYLHLEGYDVSTKNKIYYTINFEDFFEIDEDFSVSGTDPNIREIAYSSLDDKFIIANDYDGSSEYYIWELIFIENIKQIKTINDLTQEFFIDLFLQQYGYNLRTLLKNDTITLNSKSAFIKNIKKINVNKGTRKGFNTFFNSYRSKDFEDPNVHIRITDELFYDNVDDTVIGFSDPINEADPFPERYEPIPFMYKIETNLDPAAFREVLQNSIHPIGFRMIYDFISSWNEILATDRAGGSMEEIETEFTMIPSSDYEVHEEFSDILEVGDKFTKIGKINDYIYTGTNNGKNYLMDTNDLDSAPIDLKKVDFRDEAFFSCIVEGDGEYFTFAKYLTVNHVYHSLDKIHWHRVSELDYLDIRGGVYTDTMGYVCYENRGIIYTSPDGKAWTRHDDFEDTYYWNRVVNIANVAWFIGVDDDSNGVIMHTSDAITWNVCSLPPDTNRLSDICFGNGHFVATTPYYLDTHFLVSDDAGVTWTKYPNPNYIKEIEFDGTKFIGGCYFFSGTIFESSDGITWTELSDLAGHVKSLIWDETNSRVIILHDDCSLSESLDNGVTWDNLTSPYLDRYCREIFLDSINGDIIMPFKKGYGGTEKNEIYIIDDENNITQAGESLELDNIYDVINTRDKIIVLGSQLYNGEYYCYFESNNGLHWTRKKIPGVMYLFKGIYFNSNVYMLEVTGDLYKANINDFEGTVEQVTDFTGEGHDLTLFNGKLMIVDAGANLTYWCPITDLTDWNSFALDSTLMISPFKIMTHGNHCYMFSSGKIAKSTDGLNWEQAYYDFLRDLPGSFNEGIAAIESDNNQILYITKRFPITVYSSFLKFGGIKINLELSTILDSTRSSYDLDGILYNNGYWFIVNHRNGIIFFEAPDNNKNIGYV